MVATLTVRSSCRKNGTSDIIAHDATRVSTADEIDLLRQNMRVADTSH